MLPTVECILSATEDVAEALLDALHTGDLEPLLPQKYIRIEVEYATLTMTTSDEHLSWVTWGQTLKALRLFLDRWEYVGLMFVIEERGVRVAVGLLLGR